MDTKQQASGKSVAQPSASSPGTFSPGTPPSGNAVSSRTVQDDLDKLVVEQLHKATLNFSQESQEIKKLCVTLVTANFTLVAAFSKTIARNLELTRIPIALLCGAVPLLFWFVDAMTYYYQKRLRFRMQERLNAIRERCSIPKEDEEKKVTPCQALLSGSNLMYPVLSVLVSFVIFALMGAQLVDDAQATSTPSAFMVIICTEAPTPAPALATIVPPQTT